MTFSGTATDDGTIKSVYVALLNNSTGENLTVDGTWGIDNGLNLYKLPVTPERAELQLDVDDAAGPDAGQLHLRGAGDRQREHHHAADGLGDHDDERRRARRRAARRGAHGPGCPDCRRRA